MSQVAEHDLAERARKLFAGPVEFLKSAPGLQFLPEPETVLPDTVPFTWMKPPCSWLELSE